MREIDHLVKMANQIADNFSFHADAEERTADHLRRFWAPSMRQRLAEYSSAGGGGLQPVAQRALQQLADA
jgi:formate dehydrogenase subunit delta